MATIQRSYRHPDDFTTVSGFLTHHYQDGNQDGNWFQPVFEYAVTHPWFDETATDRIGIWEDGGEIVGLATYELRLGEAFFAVHPAYEHLKPEMLTHAEEWLTGTDDEDHRTLRVFVNDFDTAFERVVVDRGYELAPRWHRPMSQFSIPSPFPPIEVPDGYRLQSLADENDLQKVHRVLHRGFNHEGEPPLDGIAGRIKMQSGPHFRKDLTIVGVAPNGDYVSYGGLWLDEVNRFGYVEPVCTDPDHRRRGLGRATVLEGIRRCGAEGATVAYVGTDKPFYLSFGFRTLFVQRCWRKRFDG